MKSIISSAVLGAVALAQSGMAASIHQHHLAHVHRRAPTPAPVAEDKRGLISDVVQFISTSDLASLATKGIKTGVNAACADKSASTPITVGSDGGAFVVEMNNNSPDDIVLVVWTGEGQWGAVSASFIGASQPAVTHTLKSNTTTWISFDPTQVSGNSVSGGWGAIYPDTTLTSYSGQLGNTWAEYTFTTDSQFSTVDVSRLVYMSGNKMELHNYPDKASADNADIEPVCSSTMDKCAFVCADGEDHCIAGSITGCPVGEAGNTSDGVDNGGCAGLSAEGGYIVSNFF